MRLLRACFAGVLLTIATVTSTSAASPDPTYGVSEQVNIPFVMSDGTTLVGSVYRPAVEGRFPVLVTMTPYGVWDGNSTVSPHPPNGGSDDQMMRFFAAHGYIGLEVDTRGSGRSEGLFTVEDPQQMRDYLQVIDVAAHHLAGSNGVVGLTGMSYRGLNQLLVGGLLRKGTPVKAMAPASAGATTYDDPFVQGGFASQFWYAYPAILGISAAPPPDQDAAPGGADPRLAQVAADRALSAQNLADMATHAMDGGPVAHRDTWWEQREPVQSASAIVAAEVPVLLTTGPTDFFPRGAFRMYAALQAVAHGRSPSAPMDPSWRPDRRFQLVYGTSYTDGDLTYWLGYELQWYDHWLKGRHNGVGTSDDTLRLQDQRGRWWGPPRGTYPLVQRYTKLFLGPGAQLSTRSPTAGSVGTLPWQPETTMLSFTGPAYDRGATVAGPVTATILLRSTTPQVELIAQLNDLAPDGSTTTAVPGFEVDGDLAGTLRAVDSSRSWYDRTGTLISPYHPYSSASERVVPVGQEVRLDVELHPRVWTLAPGHRLQLVLSTQSNRVVPDAPQQQALAGGTYSLSVGSYLAVPLLPMSAFPAVPDPTTGGLR